MEEMGETEKQRIKEQVEKLGSEGLKKKADDLEKATTANEVSAPCALIYQFQKLDLGCSYRWSHPRMSCWRWRCPAWIPFTSTLSNPAATSPRLPMSTRIFPWGTFVIDSSWMTFKPILSPSVEILLNSCVLRHHCSPSFRCLAIMDAFHVLSFFADLDDRFDGHRMPPFWALSLPAHLHWADSWISHHERRQ